MRQLGDGLIEDPPEPRVDPGLRLVLHGRSDDAPVRASPLRILQILDPDRGVPHSAQRVARSIDGDPRDPGAKIGVSAKSAQPTMDRQECFLGHVLRHVPIPHQRQRGPQDVRSVGIVERAKRFRIAALSRHDHIPVHETFRSSAWATDRASMVGIACAPHPSRCDGAARAPAGVAHWTAGEPGKFSGIRVVTRS